MKRYFLLGLALVLAVVCYFSWRAWPPRDPVHQGQAISWWLHEWRMGSKVSSDEARNAMKQSGADGLSWLIWAAEHGHRPDPLPRWKSILRQFHLWKPESKEDYYGEREAAVEALGWLYPENRAAIPVLSRLLEDPDEDLATGAAERLEGMSPEGWPALLHASSNPSAQVRRLALGSLVIHNYVGHPVPTEADIGRVVEALIKGFSDPDPGARAAAAGSLGSSRGGGARSPRLQDALVPVAALLSDPNAQVRKQAGWALLTFGPEAGEMVPKIMEATEDPDPKVRAGMARTLGSVDRKAQHSKARLRSMTQDPDLGCRIAAAMALAKFGEKPTAVITELIGLLQSSDPEMRGTAMGGLIEIGPLAGEAMPAILEAFKLPGDGGKYLWHVVSDFDRFNRDEAIPYIVQAMSHPRPEVRAAAIEFFNRSLEGTERPDVHKALQAASHDTDGRVRSAAERVLRQIKNIR